MKQKVNFEQAKSLMDAGINIGTPMSIHVLNTAVSIRN